jgi:hypothetical protein
MGPVLPFDLVTLFGSARRGDGFVIDALAAR